VGKKEKPKIVKNLVRKRKKGKLIVMCLIMKVVKLQKRRKIILQKLNQRRGPKNQLIHLQHPLLKPAMMKLLL